MKNHRFLWLRNRTTNNRKCEKARNIKEKRAIEMFNTASKPPVALPSSPSANSSSYKHPLRRVLVFALRREKGLDKVGLSMINSRQEMVYPK